MMENHRPPAVTERDDVVLEVRDLTRVFGSGRTAVRAIDGVSLEARAGELLLIMGPSGSGKTTLLSIIAGLLRPTSGRVLIDGHDVTAMKESQLPFIRRHMVGFVFQTFNLLEPLDALENVEVALNIAGERGKEARDKATAALDRLGMSDRLSFKPQALSGGEKQRVSVARALVTGAKLVLADEPTANLDSKHGREVVALLRDIAKKDRRAVVIVSHDDRIRGIADRIITLEDGRITATEPSGR
jgi:putative ABC transport system ATP-binding protein